MDASCKHMDRDWDWSLLASNDVILVAHSHTVCKPDPFVRPI